MPDNKGWLIQTEWPSFGRDDSVCTLCVNACVGPCMCVEGCALVRITVYIDVHMGHFQ